MSKKNRFSKKIMVTFLLLAMCNLALAFSFGGLKKLFSPPAKKTAPEVIENILTPALDPISNLLGNIFSILDEAPSEEGGSDDVYTMPEIADPSSAEVIRTEHSIAHINADDWVGLGYGIGYAMAEDNVCLLADMYATFAGKRSLYFGASDKNKESDFYHTYINDSGVIEEILNSPPPLGASQKAFDILDGYVHGFNTYLTTVGIDNIADATCQGAEWVRPINRVDVARTVYSVSGLGGRDLVRDGMIKAAPPENTGLLTYLLSPITVPDAFIEGILGVSLLETLGLDTAVDVVDEFKLGQLAESFVEDLKNKGSNAIALGSEATANGSGMVLANPHWTWNGNERFWQAHLNLTDQLNVSGATFIGVPMVMIGHNERVAWSYTVSAARRLALVEVPLVPGDPMSYLVDGQKKKIEETTVTIEVKQPDGSISSADKTFYSTIYGPIVNSINGIDILPWTQVSAFAFVDMNLTNGRAINQFIETAQSNSAEELYEVHARYLANPWATTTIADDQGQAIWTDVGTVPNISNAFAAACNTPLGRVLWNTFGVAVLKGGTSLCNIPEVKDSLAPNIMPADKQPVQRRQDYVLNSNESHWLTNSKQPLEGYSRVFGPEKSPRAMRTRMAHKLVLDQLEEGRFTRQDLQDAMFNNRVNLAELWVDDIVLLSEMFSHLLDSNNEWVDVSEVAYVFGQWDRTYNLDSPGALLFSRFASNSGAALDTDLTYVGLPSLPMWKTPFNRYDPVNTPSGMNPLWPGIKTALADAVKEFRDNGIPLDANLRDYQLSDYGGGPDLIPMHGGDDYHGLFNVLRTRWNGSGNDAGGGGPTFVQVTSFGNGCPDSRSLLLPSQRHKDTAWDRLNEQVIKYSRKEWVKVPFCDNEMDAAYKESITTLGPLGVDSVIENGPITNSSP